MAQKQNEQTHQIVISGVLIALAFIAVLIGKLVPNVFGFLSYDPKDAVIAISGFIYGPLTALIITVFVSFIEMITISTTGPYGFIMNIVSTCSFVIPAVCIYKKMRSVKGAFIGLGVAILSMTGMMMLWNYIITPIYMGKPRSEIAGMIMTVFMPFNLVKSGINAGITLVLYKPLITALRRARLVPASTVNKGKPNWLYMLVSLSVLAVFVLAFLKLLKVF